MTFVDVALPLALPTALTYSVPDELKERAVAGARVLVPVKGREMVGIITATGRPAPAARARDILEAPDETPVLDSTLLQLADWMGAHYAASPGLVLRAMLPAALYSEGRPIRRKGADGSVEVITATPSMKGLEKTERVFALAQDTGLLERDRRFARAPRQREAVEAIAGLGGQASVLAAHAGRRARRGA